MPENPVAGFGVTFKDMFKKRLTEQYPEYKKPTAPRFHGRHQLNRHPDGLEKCIGCELCAWACPADAIYVEGADNTDEERYSPGERYGRVYQINYLRCILCGLCVEACPTRALTMTNDYELADSSRESLIYTKEELLAGLEEDMVDSPHAIYPGMTEQDYYRGLVTEAAPGTVQQTVHDTGVPQPSAETFGPDEPADEADAEEPFEGTVLSGTRHGGPESQSAAGTHGGAGGTPGTGGTGDTGSAGRARPGAEEGRS